MTGSESMLVLTAPLEGWAAPIGETPDPVFADKMLGDGVAIDPVVGEVRAPCAGVIVGLPQSRHAVTLRAVNGAEILIHIGLETVGLGGQGFACRVSDGTAVAAGTSNGASVPCQSANGDTAMSITYRAARGR